MRCVSSCFRLNLRILRYGLFVLIITLSSWSTSNIFAQTYASDKNKQKKSWHASQNEPIQTDEVVVDLGPLYVPKTKSNNKKILEIRNKDEERLKLLLKEKEQLENILQQLNHKKRELRSKSRIKKKRRCT